MTTLQSAWWWGGPATRPRSWQVTTQPLKGPTDTCVGLWDFSIDQICLSLAARGPAIDQASQPSGGVE